MKHPNVIIIGAGAGKTSFAQDFAIEKAHRNEILVIESEANPLTKAEPILFTRLPEIPMPYIDTSKPYFNYKKHAETCAKNRRNRNKKRK